MISLSVFAVCTIDDQSQAASNDVVQINIEIGEQGMMLVNLRFGVATFSTRIVVSRLDTSVSKKILEISL